MLPMTSIWSFSTSDVVDSDDVMFEGDTWLSERDF
jgi:hypothetical protein